MPDTGTSGYEILTGSDGNDTFQITDRHTWIYDPGGVDTAIVSADFVKVPSFIENVTYVNGAQPLPYWIDALVSDDAPLVAGVHQFQFGFPSYQPAYDTQDIDSNAYTPFTPIQADFTRNLLRIIPTEVNVQFTETTNFDSANVIAFAANQQDNSSGYAYLPSPDSLGSDIFINGAIGPAISPGLGTLSELIWLHEIGHALGLKHSGDTGAPNDTGPYLPASEDWTNKTVMSYHLSDVNTYFYGDLDIAALQYLYGPNPGARTTNDTYTLSATAPNFIWDGAGNDTIDASSQYAPVTLYLEPGYWGCIGSKAATITAAGQVTVNFGTVIENLVGGHGNDYLAGNAVANSIDGGAGNDTLVGGAGSDTLMGDTGIDQANYDGPVADFIVDANPLGQTVADKASGDVDLLYSVERLHFSDGNVALDIDGHAGEAYRLYQAAFDRKPDLPGLGYQIHDLDIGFTLEQVAGNFIASPEFQRTYGNVDNTQFVTLLYRNVLHREPDSGGLQFHLDELAHAQTRADVLIHFSESPENQANVIGDIQGGIDYIA